ncbi:ABC transporter permease, partial [Xanthomonas citri pv. citri]
MNDTSLRVSASVAGTPPRPRLRLPASSLGWLLPLVFFAGLELASALGWTPSYLLPPPSQILRTLADEASRGLASPVGASELR